MSGKKAATAPTARAELASVSDPNEHGLLIGSENGSTSIQPHVVAKIAGLAIREVDGVHALVPYNAGQTITSFARSIRGAQMREMGVNVEVGTVEAAVDSRIVVEFGKSIPTIAGSIRDNVASRVREMTGLTVKEINIEVVDLWFEEDHLTPPPPPSNERQLR